tara:strand:+ start:8954 stop:9493 length:540 start_codon:yes stop_codon:yes gene_type:complete
MKNIISRNKKYFLEDKKGKTRAFFIKSKKRKIDKIMIKDMIKLTKKDRSTIRLCLHQSINDLHHSMLIIDYKNNYTKPHFHLKTSETHQTLIGKLAVIIFSKTGKIIKKYVLDGKNNFLDRLEARECHLLLPLSNFVIYHETNNGKFNRNKPDMYFPNWFEKMTEERKKIFFKKLYKTF